MHKITPKQQKIIKIFLVKKKMQSSQAHREIIKTGEDASLVTVKRALSEMAEEKILELIKQIKSANFNATPSKFKCEYCDFNSICRFRQ